MQGATHGNRPRAGSAGCALSVAGGRRGQKLVAVAKDRAEGMAEKGGGGGKQVGGAEAHAMVVNAGKLPNV